MNEKSNTMSHWEGARAICMRKIEYNELLGWYTSHMYVKKRIQ